MGQTEWSAPIVGVLEPAGPAGVLAAEAGPVEKPGKAGGPPAAAPAAAPLWATAGGAPAGAPVDGEVV